MCWQDFEIAKRIACSKSNVSVSGTAISLVKSTSQRIGLLISNDHTEDLRITIGGDPATTVGMLLRPGQPPLELDFRKHGDLVTKEFRAITVSGNTIIIEVWEFFMTGDDPWKR